MSRVLGRCRLSKGTDESTSIERQREHIIAWCKNRGHEIVGWAEDVDLSGSVDPLSQRSLAPWLQPPKIHQWDIIVVWKQSRLTRGGITPLFALIEHCKSFDKDIQATHDTIEIASMSGQLIAAVRSLIDKAELENTRERVLDSRDKLRREGRYAGGPVPYGYVRVKNDGAASGYRLAPDPVTSKIVAEMADRVIRYESITSIAADLTERGVKPPRKGTKSWHPQNISRILRRPSVIGHYEHDGALLIGDDGLPVQMWPPLIAPSVQQQAIIALDNKSRVKKFKNDKALLFGVVFCAHCESIMYLRVSRKPKPGGYHEYKHWRCSRKGCEATGIRESNVQMQFERLFLRQLDNVYRTVSEFIPADDRSEQLDKVRGSIRRLKAESDAGVIDDEQEYLDRLRNLTRLRKELEAQTVVPAHTVTRVIEPRETWGQAWVRMDNTERRELLNDAEVRIYVLDKTVTRVVTPGAWLRDDVA